MLGIIDSIVGSLTFVITSIIYANILLEKKIQEKSVKNLIKLLIGIIIYVGILRYTTGTPKTLLVFFFHVVQFRYMFKISYTQSMLLSFLYIILAMVPDALFLLFLMYVLKIPPEICYTKYTGSIIATISVGLMLIAIIYIFRKILRKITKVKIYKKIDENKMILIYTALTILCVIMVYYKATEKDIINESLLEGIILMIVFIMILYNLIKQKIENEKIEEKYDKLLEFIKKYEVIIEEQRELRHESKNQLITVKSKVLNKEEGKEIIKYVDSLLKDHKSYKEDKYGMFQYLPSNGIKGLFYYKSMEAEEKGINLSIRIAEKVEKSILSKLSTEDFKQLGRLVGVYLDNAIEASNNSEEKKLGIEIYKHNEDVIIIITNTYNGEIEKESIGKVRYSTKGKNRGYGLMLVNKILSKNKRFASENTITDKLYIQKLVIKKSI